MKEMVSVDIKLFADFQGTQSLWKPNWSCKCR